MIVKNRAHADVRSFRSAACRGSAEPLGQGLAQMPVRLVALEEGPDIPLDRAMLVVGRHPQCDARLDSIRVSRRHCCMMQDKDSGEVVVRDLGSTNGIRINGQRVEMGKLRPGDELAIAHIRYRLEQEQEPGHDVTLAETARGRENGHHPFPGRGTPPPLPAENPLAAAVRDLLPSAVAERCRIQVIVQMHPDADTPESRDPCTPGSSP